MALLCTLFNFISKNTVALKSESGVIQGHWNRCHSIFCPWFPISVL